MDAQLLQEMEMLHERICQALSDPKRLMLLYLMNGHPRSVGELALELNIPQPTISHHLKILRERSFVKMQKEGTTVYYTLADSRIIEALDLLRGILRDSLTAQARLAEFSALNAERKESE
ncbi:MAG TPA: metalloregulator ArsR/SmtB family transcription factor [Aggregatilineales bacterium]|nr:metalloregulator ArsR/SmtB family transcription factor [Aggregatilineales bacterium]